MLHGLYKYIKVCTINPMSSVLKKYKMEMTKLSMWHQVFKSGQGGLLKLSVLGQIVFVLLLAATHIQC